MGRVMRSLYSAGAVAITAVVRHMSSLVSAPTSNGFVLADGERIKSGLRDDICWRNYQRLCRCWAQPVPPSGFHACRSCKTGGTAVSGDCVGVKGLVGHCRRRVSRGFGTLILSSEAPPIRHCMSSICVRVPLRFATCCAWAESYKVGEVSVSRHWPYAVAIRYSAAGEISVTICWRRGSVVS